MAVQEKSKLVNEVDTSPEKINAEWRQIAVDECLNISGSDIVSSPENPENEAEGIPEVDRQGAASSIAIALGVLFSQGFKYFAPKWAVTKNEVLNLAALWSAVAAKHLPLSWIQKIPTFGNGSGECIECDALEATVQLYLVHANQPETEPENIPESVEPGQTSDFEGMKTYSEINSGGAQ